MDFSFVILKLYAIAFLNVASFSFQAYAVREHLIDLY